MTLHEVRGSKGSKTDEPEFLNSSISHFREKALKFPQHFIHCCVLFTLKMVHNHETTIYSWVWLGVHLIQSDFRIL